MSSINYFKDRDGNIVYPRTLAEAVYLPNGENLASLLHGNPNTVFKDIVVTPNQPEDTSVLWLDPSEDDLYYRKFETYSRTEVLDLISKITIEGTNLEVAIDLLVEEYIEAHDINKNSHNDLRLLIEGLTTRLNALADSDDTTLDQMSELVAYVKSNKSLIDSITSGKVNVTDIVDNLTTSASNKPLSAKQGVALKALINAIVVPTKTSQLTNDSNFAVKSHVVNLPKDSNGVIIKGTVGQIPVSDGAGGITWSNVTNGNEVTY